MMICPNGTIRVRRLERTGSRVAFLSRRTMAPEPRVILAVRTSTSKEAAMKTVRPGIDGCCRSVPNASSNEENQIAVAPCSLGSSLICLRKDSSKLSFDRELSRSAFSIRNNVLHFQFFGI
jgi:hypothetical protein